MASRVFFKRYGNGPAVILLHGFPMNHAVWNDFAPALAEDYTVYTPDLPGLGQSPLVAGNFSLDDVAAVLESWIQDEGIPRAVVVGHSLGGYVALALARRNPALFAGLVLFHSTAYPDSEEKKESRTKVLRFIDEHGVEAFTSNFIPPLFADPGHPGISSVRDISMSAGTEGVKGYTRAMRDRTSFVDVVRAFPAPFLFMGGEADKGISTDSLREQSLLNPRIKLKIISGAAHMGMFEKQPECIQILREFLGEISGTAG